MASFSPHSIRNKIKRVQVVQAVKAKKAADKRERREARKQVEVELGSSAPPKPVARTLDNTREWDDTYVDKNDPELLADEADDEFADIFSCSRVPKIMITTKVRPSGRIFHVLRELMSLFPNSFYYKRGVCGAAWSARSRRRGCRWRRVTASRVVRAGSYELKKICKYAANKDFTHLFVVSEKKKSVNGYVAVVSVSASAVVRCLGVLSVFTSSCRAQVARRQAARRPVCVFQANQLHVSSRYRGPWPSDRPCSRCAVCLCAPRPRTVAHDCVRDTEIILNRFETRLGRRMARLLGSMFPQQPDLKGRRIITFHNQRDFVFVRQHRYMPDSREVRQLVRVLVVASCWRHRWRRGVCRRCACRSWGPASR
jgi:ribosome production factor 1